MGCSNTKSPVPTFQMEPLAPPPEEVCDRKPNFEHCADFAPKDDVKSLMSSVVLQHDKSSAWFAKREKAISFVMVINGRVTPLAQDYFVQNADYNDFSGGYKRHYVLISKELFEGPLGEMVLKFAAYYSIPEKTVVLVQIQKSTFHDANRCSVTGQGIHTDGADRAVLVGLGRGSKVVGAQNEFHAKLDGTQPLCKPMTLGIGEAIFFKDNQIYHRVTPVQTKGDGFFDPNNSDEYSRTVLLMHSPTEVQLTGGVNESNELGTNKRSIALRERDSVGVKESNQLGTNKRSIQRRERDSVLDAGDHS